jgi:uncharacterized lipoprotein
MEKTFLKALGLLLPITMLLACGGETLIEDRYSLEYLDAKPGKPVVYPADVDAPEQSLDYAVPSVAPNAAVQKDDINEVVKPPRIVPLPKDDDD